MLSAIAAFVIIAAPSKVDVISAVYGDPNDPLLCCNVTATVQAVLQDPYPRIVVTNEEMGSDPAPDERKQFRLYYYEGNKAKELTAQEGDTVRFKVNRSAIRIRRAEFGVLDQSLKTVIVTDMVENILFDKRYRFVATPYELGVGDPAPCVVKKLMVTYSIGGQQFSNAVGEYKTFFFDPARR